MTETTFDPGSKTGALWSEMLSHYATEGISQEQFETKVNVGYLGDPFGLRKFSNLTDKIEGPEVLEWCYGHTDCYPLLAKHGFPIPFAMNDYDPAEWTDDQKRFETDQSLDGLEIKKEQPVLQQAEKIYTWSLSFMKFSGDCPVESPDWQALVANCGWCTESSSAMYYAYQHAGLAPQFYFESDLQPSMEWQDRYEHIGGNFMDHVLVGIPDKDKTIFVDRTNEEFNGSHKFAVPISPRAFAAASIENRAINFIGMSQEQQAASDMKVYMEIVPDDPLAYFDKTSSLDNSTPEEKDRLMQEAAQLYPGHPAVPLLTLIYKMGAQEGYNQLKQNSSPFRQKMSEVEKTSPAIATKISLLLASGLMKMLKKNEETLKKIRQLGDNAKSAAKEFEEFLCLDFNEFARAIKTDPNAVKGYLGMMALLDTYHDLIPVIGSHALGISEILLDDYPDHAPLHYLAGAAAGYAAQHPANDKERGQYLEKAQHHFQKVVELEPKNLSGYMALAEIDLLLQNYDAMFTALRSLAEIQKKNFPPRYYQLLFAAYFKSGDEDKMKEALEKMIKERPSDGVDLLLGFLKENFQLGFFGKVPSLEALQQQTKKSPLKKSVGVVADFLKPYPSAQTDLEIVYAKIALYDALAEGSESWQADYARLKEPRSNATMKSFEEGLEAFQKWLQSTAQNEEVLDWIDGAVEAIQQSLVPNMENLFLGIYVAMVQYYIALHQPEKADRILKKMMQMDSTKTVMIYVQRVVQANYADAQGKKEAMDLIKKHKGEIAPEVFDWIEKKEIAHQ